MKRHAAASLCLLLVAGFLGLGLARLPQDAILRYDEATHLFEGMRLRDVLVEDGPLAAARLFDTEMTMKGVLYRVYFALAFLDGGVSAERGRAAGLLAACAALLVLGLLARELAPPGRRGIAAVAAVAFGALAPLLHTWGRSAMVEPLNLFTLLLALYLVARDRRLETKGSGALAVLGLLLAFLTKYNHAVILAAACGLDALLVAWSRRREPWARRLRPFVPLALAALPLAAWALDPDWRQGFWYYLRTVPGGEDDVDPSGLVYVDVLATRLAPGVAGTILLGAAFAAGLPQASRGRGRLVLFHLGIGLVLAQSNALKLERILVPLMGDLFLIAGLGAAALLAALARRRGARVALVAGAALLLVHALVQRGAYAIETEPLHHVRPVLDAMVETAAANKPPRGKLLVLGQGFFGGRGSNLTAPHLVLRARELGLPLARDEFEYLTAEASHKALGTDLHGRDAATVDGERLRAYARPYPRIVVLYDAIAGRPPAPLIIAPVDRRIAQVLEVTDYRRASERRIAVPKGVGAPEVVVALLARK